MPSNNSPALTLNCNPAWQFWVPSLQRIVAVTWQSDGQWLLTLNNHTTSNAVLRVDSWLSAGLLCLRWQLPTGKARALLVWRWQLSHAAWHQWRLRLYQQGAVRTSPPDVST